MKKYIVRLTAEERKQLQELIDKGTVAALRRKHAQVLLWADQAEGSPAWTDQEIAAAGRMHVRTVETIRQRLVEEGLVAALERKKREPRPPKLDGAQQARITAMACSKPPDGYARWSLRLLADKAVQLEIVDSVGKDAIRDVLKKTNCVLT